MKNVEDILYKINVYNSKIRMLIVSFNRKACDRRENRLFIRIEFHNGIICDFLLVRHSNPGRILHRFRESVLQVFVLMTPPLFHPNFFWCSCWTRSPMLGSARAETLT